MIVLKNHGEFTGDFVLDVLGAPVSLGDYLEVIYTGPLRATTSTSGRVIWIFPLILIHSLIHDGAEVEADFCTSSVHVANLLGHHLEPGRLQHMRVVRYTSRGHTWYWPGVDGWQPVLRRV